MKNKEEIDGSSLDLKQISEQEKKYVIAGIVFLSFLIVVLLGLIAEAYINQHPAFEFLQYTYNTKSDFQSTLLKPLKSPKYGGL